MTQYAITYKNGELFHSILINANDPETARAFFAEHQPSANICGDVTIATADDQRPGKPCLTVPEDFIIETPQEKTMRENFEHCKRIGDTLEEYAHGNMYKCPHCGEIHTFTDYESTEHTNEEDDIFYTCPACEEDIIENELEAVSFYDYFNDVFDIEYRVGSDRQYRSAKIMIACGGPNIYIDTADHAVKLYWWNERAEYGLSSYTCEQIDQYFEELYNC